MKQLPVGAPFQAISDAFDQGAPLQARDVLKYEPAAVRALFDEGLIEQQTRRRGRTTFAVIVPTAMARFQKDEERARAADPWQPKAIAYLREAYPGGALFREMAAVLGVSGGRILMKAQALKLVRPGFAAHANRRKPKRRRARREDNWMTTPAWRVHRLRVALKDAQARGTNPFDDGEGLGHRALWRRFERGRAAPETFDKLKLWTDAENAILREHYPRGGSKACLPLLPGRSAGAIRHQGSLALKLKAPRDSHIKHLATPEVDAAIRRVYRARIGKGQVKDLNRRRGDIKMVTGWIGKGLLKARRRGTWRTAGQGGDQWWIHKRDFRRFVYANPHLIDLRNVEPVLFLELLAGKVPGRRTLKALPNCRRKAWAPARPAPVGAGDTPGNTPGPRDFEDTRERAV